MSRTTGAPARPGGPLHQRLASCTADRVDALAVQRLVLAVVNDGLIPLPGDEREPTPTNHGPGAADRDAAGAWDRPIPCPKTAHSSGPVEVWSSRPAASLLRQVLGLDRSA
jgi:hypothetical protein